MKKLHTVLIGAALLGVASGCSVKRQLLKAPVVSMTMDSISPGYKTASLGAVSSQFCPGESPYKKDDDIAVGMMDEAIWRAQNEHGASYIKDAQFYVNEKNCVILEGEAMK